MARFDLSDAEWAAIQPNLPKQGRGPQRRDDRKILDGISTSYAPKPRGGIFPAGTARRRQPTIAMSGGAIAACGAIFLRPWPPNATMR
jgi:transposase|nr:transposase [Ruegeria sp. EL01]